MLFLTSKSDSLLIPCCMIQLLRQAWAAAPQKLLASSLPRSRRRLPARATGPADHPDSPKQVCKREHETCEVHQVLAVRMAAKQCQCVCVCVCVCGVCVCVCLSLCVGDKLQHEQRKECRPTGCTCKHVLTKWRCNSTDDPKGSVMHSQMCPRIRSPR